MAKPVVQIMFSVIRWTARILSVLLAGVFALFLVGEGVPSPSDLTPREIWAFVAIFIEFTGLFIAWRFELFGAVFSLVGYVMFSLLMHKFWIPPIFPFIPAAAILFLICVFESQPDKSKTHSTTV